MGYMRLSDLRRRISKAGTYSDHHKNWLFTIAQMKLPLVYDGRNLYDPKRMKEAGVAYHSIGRESV